MRYNLAATLSLGWVKSGTVQFSHTLAATFEYSWQG